MAIFNLLKHFIKFIGLFVFISTYPTFLFANDNDSPQYDQMLLDKLGIKRSTIQALEINSTPSGEYLVNVYINEKLISKQWVEISYNELINKEKLLYSSIKNYLINDEDMKNITFDYQHNNGKLYITIPQHILNKKEQKNENNTVSLIVNYEGNFFKPKQEDMDDDPVFFAYSKTTLNLYGWSLVNDLSYSSTKDEKKFDRNTSYLKREFNNGKEFQLGEIFTRNSLFSGLKLNGFQYTPSNDYLNLATTQTITGFVDTPSTVEVYQNGKIIFSRNITAGEYRIDNLRTDASSKNVVVKIISSDGRVTEKTYNLELKNNNSGHSWYSIAVGHSKIKDELLATVTYDYKIENINFNFGGLASTNYYNFSAGYEQNLSNIANIQASIYSAFSYDLINEQSGVTANIQLNGELLGNILSFSQTYYSDEYTDYLFSEPSDNTNAQLKSSTSVSISKAFNKALVTSLGYAQDTYYNDNNDKSNRAFASINSRFDYFSLGLFYQYTKLDSSVNVTFSIPLGKKGGIISSTYSRSDNRNNLNSFYSQPVGNNVNFSMGANLSTTKTSNLFAETERENQSYYLRTGIKAGMTTANLGVNYAKNENSVSTTYNAGISGGIAFSKYGVDFSPSAIDNTFAIVKFNDDIRNVDVYGSFGVVDPVFSGRALIPRINPYRKNQLALDTKYLPNNMYSVGGFKPIKPDYASVSLVEFNIVKNSFVMLNIIYNGLPIDSGWYIVNHRDEYVTVIGEGGIAGIEEFNLNSNTSTKSYYVTNGNTKLCRFKIDYSKVNNNDISRIHCSKY